MPERLPRDPGVHRPDGGAGRGHRPDPRAPARRDRTGHDRRLRTALPALAPASCTRAAPHRLVPAADVRPPGRSGHPRLAVHVRPAHRRPGGRRLRRDRRPRPADPARPPRAPTRTPGWPRSSAPSGGPSRPRSHIDLGGLTHMHHRLHRTRPDGGQHGPPAPAGRPRGRRLQPHAGEDDGDRRPRARRPSFSIEELVEQARDAARGLDHGPGRRRDRGPDRGAASSTSSRATRSSTAATRTSTTTCAATQTLKAKGIHYVDAGISGGIWGLQVGYCLMVGGEPEAVTPLEPIFLSLAPEGRLPPRRRRRAPATT